MVKRSLTILFFLIISVSLTSCWSKYELTERGFVMGLALDKGKDGTIEMLTQIYRPSSAGTTRGSSSSVASINIKTSANSIAEAIRDIPIHLGRKAQWSHMRIIIVSDKLAESVNIGQLLDLFYRDHEPRSSVSLMISKGPARKYFEVKPFIEQTTSQQLVSTEKYSHNNSAKTLATTLLDLVLQLKNAHNDAVVSYIYEDTHQKNSFSSAGLALFKKGMMKGVLPPKRVESLVLLRDEYDSGIIEIPCKDKKNLTQSIEILSIQTKMKTNVSGDRISVKVNINGNVAIDELKCSSVVDPAAESKLIHEAEQQLMDEMHSTIEYLQTIKMDVMGVGNQIYRKNPKQWIALQKDWDKHFSEIPFEVKVKLKLVTTGTHIGTTIF